LGAGGKVDKIAEKHAVSEKSCANVCGELAVLPNQALRLTVLYYLQKKGLQIIDLKACNIVNCD
jgi:hypothetical protein